MSLLVNQPAGLGDIFFIQKIISVLSEHDTVHHPVHPAFWYGGVDRVVTRATGGPFGPFPDSTVINLDQSLPMLGVPNDQLMKSKYDLVGIDYGDWADYFKYMRVSYSEMQLADKLGVTGPFVLVNPYFGPPYNRKAIYETRGDVPDGYDGQVVEIDSRHASNIFDWCWLLENAEEIYTVDGSICYILETLDIKATRLTMHPRHYDYSKALYDGILKRQWQWAEYGEDRRVDAPL